MSLGVTIRNRDSLGLVRPKSPRMNQSRGKWVRRVTRFLAMLDRSPTDAIVFALRFDTGKFLRAVRKYGGGEAFARYKSALDEAATEAAKKLFRTAGWRPA